MKQNESEEFKLEEKISSIAAEGSVVIFKVPNDQVEKVGLSLSWMPFWQRRNIIPLACPDHFEIVVVPEGSSVKVE